MKIAYLTSKYPAVSHTFILREVLGLRARGATIGTFSVRRATPADTLGVEAVAEAERTRWLVGAPLGEYLRALGWALRRPWRAGRVLAGAVGAPGMGWRRRIQWLFYFAEAVLLARWLVQAGFEHLHCHFGNSGASTGLLAAELAGIPFSFTCHGSELLEPAKYRLADKVAAASFVACVSKYGRAQLMLNCPPAQWTKLRIVRCGLNLDAVPPVTTSAPPTDILCVARLSREKGHLVLLEALARLRREGLHVRCTLVGDGPMRSAITARIAELGLNHAVTLTGSLEPDEVRAHYRAARAFVLPSFSEGVPIVLMEAMSLGLPVVATRVGGVAELVKDRVHGLLVAPGDGPAMAQALRRLLADTDLATRMGRRGQRRVHTWFTIQRSADRLAELFAAALQSTETGTRLDRRKASCPPELTVEVS